MTTQNKNVFALRFPEFDEDWEEKTISDIGTVIRGASPRPQGDKRYYGGNVPRLMVADVTRDGKFVTPKIDFLTEEGAKLSRPCKAGTLTIVCSGTVGIPSILAVDACIHDGFLAVIDIDKKYDTEYLYHQLSTLRDKFEKSATHGGVFTNLTTAGIKEFSVTFPTLPEQQKIAAFLTAVDEKIQQITKKKDLLEQYKKGVMQKIFNQEIRFKDGDGNDFADWEKKKLGEVGTFFSGGTPSTTKREYFDGEIPFIRSGEINSDKTEQFITEAGLKNSSAKKVEVGDLLYALYGATSGEVGISKISGAINQAVLCIRTNLDNNFLHNFLLFKKESIINTFLQGGQGNLSAELVKSFKIPIPSKPEQQKIANFLSAIDKKINLVNQQLEKTKEYKKGLLQQMFI
jgi:type I restriction enzyme S subunit